RVVWLGMGVLRLLRLKRGGVVVDALEYSELQQQLRTRATIAHVAALPQPATFGVRRPIVLLPDALAAAPSSLRRAVVAHELFHVRRRDWVSVLAEEMVRTALWFHPAIHWMTAQIQLAREEIVDELTVRATGDRRTYVEALLAFADTPGLSPAPAFAHRRQLFHRILSVSKENVMSRPRVVSSAAVLIAGVVGASWYASTLFPIVKAATAETPLWAQQAAADASTQAASRAVAGGNVESRDGAMTLRASVSRPEQRGNSVAVHSVTPENPIPRRTRGVALAWPAQLADIPTWVSVLVTVDRNGAVTSVDRDECRSGRNDLTACATAFDVVAAAVRQWRYDRPAQAPLQFHVDVTYRPGTEPTVTQSGGRASDWAAYVRETQDSLRVSPS
ncbi:MAG TPA: M56 family metallopeptidase, partial [Vicinamibacterales bacterium]|nr:M56 family metallopeptidase [Vicinamibacterales bacterium]